MTYLEVIILLLLWLYPGRFTLSFRLNIFAHLLESINFLTSILNVQEVFKLTSLGHEGLDELSERIWSVLLES